MKIKPFLNRGRLLMLAACLAVPPAMAHFQTLYVQESTLARGADLDIALVFTHPFQGGPTMPMSSPRAFHVTTQRAGAEPTTTDLKPYLRPVDWQGDGHAAAAFRAKIPRDLMRSLGDHVFVVEPEPYLEAEEDLYIQQFTKVVVNVGGVPSGWTNAQGLAAEIQPLTRPYGLWTGSVLRAIVLSNGKPVPFARVEVEYLNRTVDLKAGAFGKKAIVKAPHAAYERLSVNADGEGVIAVGLPKEGWWGIAALDVGSVKSHQGKTLSQDAVLWVQVKDMR